MLCFILILLCCLWAVTVISFLVALIPLSLYSLISSGFCVVSFISTIAVVPFLFMCTHAISSKSLIISQAIDFLSITPHITPVLNLWLSKYADIVFSLNLSQPVISMFHTNAPKNDNINTNNSAPIKKPVRSFSGDRKKGSPCFLITFTHPPCRSAMRCSFLYVPILQIAVNPFSVSEIFCISTPFSKHSLINPSLNPFLNSKSTYPKRNLKNFIKLKTPLKLCCPALLHPHG